MNVGWKETVDLMQICRLSVYLCGTICHRNKCMWTANEKCRFSCKRLSDARVPRFKFRRFLPWDWISLTKQNEKEKQLGLSINFFSLRFLFYVFCSTSANNIQLVFCVLYVYILNLTLHALFAPLSFAPFSSLCALGVRAFVLAVIKTYFEYIYKFKRGFSR